MARTKKTKVGEKAEVEKKEVEVVAVPEQVEVVPTTIALLSIDYANEGLNNMARKINEVIEKING